jgi:tetratricopeptide (TPR) repeat protein
MKKFILVLLLSVLFFTARSQNQVVIDILKIELKNAKEDTVKIQTLLELSSLYTKFDLIQALDYGNHALEILVKKEHNRFITKSSVNIGVHYISIGNYDVALMHFLEGLKLATEMNYSWETIILNLNIGVVYDRMGKFDNALDYYFRALNIYNTEKENNNFKQSLSVGTLYNNIGNIYQTKANLETAEEYRVKGLKLAKEGNDFKNSGVLYNNLGKIRKDQNDQYNDAHLKAAIIAPGKTIPIIKGKLALSKCQKIFFCEFDQPNIQSEIIVTPFHH